MRIRGLLALVSLLLVAAADPADSAHPFDNLQLLSKKLRPFVERAVGVRFPKDPVVRELTLAAALAAAQADLRADVARKVPNLSAEGVETRVRALAAASVRSSIARYSTTLRCVVLVRAPFDRQMESLGIAPEDAPHVLAGTLAHELVHALDDARTGLAALRKKTTGPEAHRALSMVIEGRAVHYGRRAARAFGVPERALTGIEGQTVRRAYLRLTYESGADFISTLEERGGRALAERALVHAPQETHFVFHPERWPDGRVDARPAKILSGAYPDLTGEPLSELELRARYESLDGPGTGGRLFAGFRGGAKVLAVDTNAVVLAFVDVASARAFTARSKRDAPTERRGTLVIKANGERAAKVLELLREAIKSHEEQ